VDGTKGSAVATLRDVYTQRAEATPRPVWNPDIAQPINFFEGWAKVPEYQVFDNAFKIQWELFLKHVVTNEPFRWTLLEGAKGVQLAEAGLESSAKRAWVSLDKIG
jgi:predicted dehydrogenase